MAASSDVVESPGSPSNDTESLCNIDIWMIHAISTLVLAWMEHKRGWITSMLLDLPTTISTL